MHGAQRVEEGRSEHERIGGIERPVIAHMGRERSARRQVEGEPGRRCGRIRRLRRIRRIRRVRAGCRVVSGARAAEQARNVRVIDAREQLGLAEECPALLGRIGELASQNLHRCTSPAGELRAGVDLSGAARAEQLSQLEALDVRMVLLAGWRPGAVRRRADRCGCDRRSATRRGVTRHGATPCSAPTLTGPGCREMTRR